MTDATSFTSWSDMSLLPVRVRVRVRVRVLVRVLERHVAVACDREDDALGLLLTNCKLLITTSRHYQVLIKVTTITN